MADSWNPQQYEKFKNERSQPFFDLMDLIPAESCFKNTLDLGCGSGELTALLHERFHNLNTLGIDSSAKMLRQAPAVSGLEFRQLEIENIDSLGSFDLIFSNAALQWCKNHRELFKNVSNHIPQGGQLAVQMPMNHDYPTHTIARALAQEEPFRTWLFEENFESSLLSSEEYSDLLEQIGFKEKKVEMKTYLHTLPSREEVIEWVRGTMLTRYQSRLTPEQFKKFENEFRQKLFAVLPDDRPFIYPFKRILMWGRKHAQ
jgi:trans-aconitate 2-methyltransferase